MAQDGVWMEGRLTDGVCRGGREEHSPRGRSAGEEEGLPALQRGCTAETMVVIGEHSDAVTHALWCSDKATQEESGTAIQ